MNMAQGMEQLRGNPMLSQMMGGAGAGAPGLPPAAFGGGGAGGFPDLAALMGGMGGMPAGFGVPPPVADPEVAYATQMQQLVDMGFYDRCGAVRCVLVPRLIVIQLLPWTGCANNNSRMYLYGCHVCC